MPRPVDHARAAARDQGARLYTSATPCAKGHPAPLQRYVSTGACRQCVASARGATPAAAPVDPLAAFLAI